MSTSPPARPSRRSLLQGAASVGVVALLASMPACAADLGGPDDGATGDEGSPLLRLGQELAAGSDGTTLAATRPATVTALATDADVVAATAQLDPEIRADLAAGRTVTAGGWLLSRTEGAVLVAYAGACAPNAC